MPNSGLPFEYGARRRSLKPSGTPDGDRERERRDRELEDYLGQAAAAAATASGGPGTGHYREYSNFDGGLFTIVAPGSSTNFHDVLGTEFNSEVLAPTDDNNIPAMETDGQILLPDGGTFWISAEVEADWPTAPLNGVQALAMAVDSQLATVSFAYNSTIRDDFNYFHNYGVAWPTDDNGVGDGALLSLTLAKSWISIVRGGESESGLGPLTIYNGAATTATIHGIYFIITRMT